MVAVVGATCPLGRHLMKALLRSQRQVLGFYRKETALPGWWNQAAGFQAVQFDLEEPASLARLLESSTHIIWLAQSTRLSSLDDPNVTALQAVLSQSRHSRRVVLVSSGGTVYGSPEELPVREEHLCRPISPYGRSKRQMEQILLNYAQSDPAISYVIIRPGNIYGQEYLNGEGKGCVAAFAYALLHDLEVPLVEKGLTVRDFIHVDDVVQGILMGLDRTAGSAIWNVGSGTGTRIYTVLEMISTILNRAPKGFRHVQASATDIREIFLDIRRIKDESGWHPTMSLREGLEYTLTSS